MIKKNQLPLPQRCHCLNFFCDCPFKRFHKYWQMHKKCSIKLSNVRIGYGPSANQHLSFSISAYIQIRPAKLFSTFSILNSSESALQLDVHSRNVIASLCMQYTSTTNILVIYAFSDKSCVLACDLWTDNGINGDRCNGITNPKKKLQNMH